MLSCIQMTKQATVNQKAPASRKYPMQLLCELAGVILDQDAGDLLEYGHLLKHPKLKETRGRGDANETGRLEQGLLPGVVEGTDTIEFIPKGDIPIERLKDCTYSRIVCNVRPEKRIQSESELLVESI